MLQNGLGLVCETRPLLYGLESLHPVLSEEGYYHSGSICDTKIYNNCCCGLEDLCMQDTVDTIHGDWDGSLLFVV